MADDTVIDLTVEEERQSARSSLAVSGNVAGAHALQRHVPGQHPVPSRRPLPPTFKPVGNSLAAAYSRAVQPEQRVNQQQRQLFAHPATDIRITAPVDRLYSRAPPPDLDPSLASTISPQHTGYYGQYGHHEPAAKRSRIEDDGISERQLHTAWQQLRGVQRHIDAFQSGGADQHHHSMVAALGEQLRKRQEATQLANERYSAYKAAHGGTSPHTGLHDPAHHRPLPSTLTASTGRGAFAGMGALGVPAPFGASKALPSLPVASYTLTNSTPNAAETLDGVRQAIEAVQHEELEEREPPQGTLRVELLRHQKLALDWMLKHEPGQVVRGGMLCDDQGLGKTVTTISLIVSHQEKRGDDNETTQPDATPSPEPSTGDGTPSRPSKAHFADSNPNRLPQAGTLVVCPTSVLAQWEGEICSKLHPSANISVHRYHGPGRETSVKALASYSVVLTTFTTMNNEAPKKIDEKKGDDAGAPIELDDSDGENGAAATPGAKAAARQKRNSMGGPLFRVHWHRVILDEAQAIKNPRTYVAHGAYSLNALYRWCLTGTPVQNSIDDLYSYFRFLRYHPFDKLSTFKKQLVDVVNSAPAKGYARLQHTLRLICLRRTKRSKINGQPILELPARNEQLMEVDFSPAEKSFYATLEKQTMEEIKAMGGSIGSGSMMRAAGVGYVNMLSLLLRLRQACNHHKLVGGHKANEVNEKDAAVQQQLQSAKRLSMTDMQQLLWAMQHADGQCCICQDIAEDPMVAICGHVFCAACINMKVDSGNNGSAEDVLSFHCPGQPTSSCGAALTCNDVFSEAVLNMTLKDGCEVGNSNGMWNHHAVTGVVPTGDSQNLPEVPCKLAGLLQLLTDIRNKSAPAPKAAAVPRQKAKYGSSRAAGSAPKRPAGDKTLVFSQWTHMLDLVEPLLTRNGFKHLRLDGTMTLPQRETTLKSFSTDPEVQVLLLSLKAASVGLNLVCANHVVLLDLWWNPAVEEQAIDRAHRIGQTKPVQVTRIIVKGTVETRMLTLQNKKRQLVENTVSSIEGGKGPATAAKVSRQELEYLFGVADLPAGYAVPALQGNGPEHGPGNNDVQVKLGGAEVAVQGDDGDMQGDVKEPLQQQMQSLNDDNGLLAQHAFQM